MKMKMAIAGRLCLFLFYTTIERSYCSCVSDGTGPIQCYMYVPTSTAKVVRMQPQLTFDHPTICELVTVASARYGSSNLTVDANETMAIVSQRSLDIYFMLLFFWTRLFN